MAPLDVETPAPVVDLDRLERNLVLADARGHTLLLRAGLIVSSVASALLVLDDRALLYAAIVVAAAVAYATFWTPALALLSQTLERQGFDQAFGFGLMSAAWPPGFAIGAAAGAHSQARPKTPGRTYSQPSCVCCRSPCSGRCRRAPSRAGNAGLTDAH